MGSGTLFTTLLIFLVALELAIKPATAQTTISTSVAASTSGAAPTSAAASTSAGASTSVAASTAHVASTSVPATTAHVASTSVPATTAHVASTSVAASTAHVASTSVAASTAHVASTSVAASTAHVASTSVPATTAGGASTSVAASTAHAAASGSTVVGSTPADVSTAGGPIATAAPGSTATAIGMSTDTAVGGSTAHTAGGSTVTAAGGSTVTEGSATAGGATHSATAGMAVTRGSTVVGLTATGGATAITHGSTTSRPLGTTTAGAMATGHSTTDGHTTTRNSSKTTGPGHAGTTKATPATTKLITTEAPAPVVVIAATLVEPFVPELNDPESEQFKALAVRVVAVYDVIYRAKFGFLFIRSFVLSFREVPGPPAARATSNTQAEVGVEFNKTASPSEVPDADAVATTLEEAVSNPNITINLTIDATSIKVVVTTTVAPTASHAPTTNAATTHAVNATAAATVSHAPTTKAATINTAAVQTTVARITRSLTFRSAGETFTTDLLNSSSAAFISRAALIKTTLEPFYRAQFFSFQALTVISFSNGSIINTANLQFDLTSVPSNTAIADVLINAAPSITAFNIDTTSITVDGAAVSSGVGHQFSLITASCLVLLSWLLSSQE